MTTAATERYTVAQAARDFDDGVRIGQTALVNASYNTVVSTVTLGNYQGGELIRVRDEDRALYSQSYAFMRVGTEILAGVATGGVARASGTIGAVGRTYQALNAASTMGRAGADMIENGFSVQNVLQMASGGINLGGTAAMSRGYQSFSQVAGTAGTWLGRGTNIAGVAVNGYDMMVNGVTAQNSAALMENVAGLAGVGWACFAAGTPIQTPTGPQNIEWFKAGDLVLSRSELDPNGPVEAKVVEEVFVRLARIVHLHVGGQVIRTTGEHPFWVESKGWTGAYHLELGDRLATLEGQWIEVEEVYDTGESETVYNLRIADHHTYFVGGGDWGFSVWVHNLYEVGEYNRVRRLSQRNVREANHTPQTAPAELLISGFNKGRGMNGSSPGRKLQLGIEIDTKTSVC